jgi:hypothetical protein
MFENERDFERVVADLRIDAEPNPAHREQLRRRMLATFAEAGRAAGADTSSPAQPKAALRIVSIGRLAAAAAIIVAAVLGVQHLARRAAGPPTLEQVRQATLKMPWMHAVATSYHDGQIRTEQHWQNSAAEKAYVLTSDGSVVCWDYGSGQRESFYNSRTRTLVVDRLPKQGLFGAKSAFNLVEAFAVLAAQDDVAVEQWPDQYDDRAVVAYEIEKADPGIRLDTKTVARLKIKLMADRRTKRLVAAHVEHHDEAGAMLAHEEWVVSYPRSGPTSVYDLGVPTSTRIIERTSQTIGTPGGEPRPIPTPGDAERSQLVPLKIDLPRPMFVGTPQDNRVPNLERPRNRPRPPFLAPLGTMNVALGKPVTSSDSEPVIGTLEMITDGDKRGGGGSFVGLGPGPQHITIDLRARYELYAIVVWHFHQYPRVYLDVVVQLSDDPSFRTGVTTVFNNDTDGSMGLGAGTDLNYTETNEGRLIDTKGIQARYVRLYSSGNSSDDLNHYIEVEAYGRPAR